MEYVRVSFGLRFLKNLIKIRNKNQEKKKNVTRRKYEYVMNLNETKITAI